MGQKVSPIGLRVGINRDWDSNWYASKDYAKFLQEDVAIREKIDGMLEEAMVDRIKISRPSTIGNTEEKNIVLEIHSARPGFVVGKDGENINNLKKEVNKIAGRQANVEIEVVEIKNPDVVARLIAKDIANQLENRASFRRVQKFAIQKAMRAGAKGIKTQVSGRLGGADMARAEGYTEGNVPLHTLRADVDYAHEEADTTYGKLGIKVWVYHGEILDK